jgi:hypothetical protein
MNTAIVNLRRIVLGVEVAPGERVELAARKREHEPRRALWGRPGSIIAPVGLGHRRAHQPRTDREDEHAAPAELGGEHL